MHLNGKNRKISFNGSLYTINKLINLDMVYSIIRGAFGKFE